MKNPKLGLGAFLDISDTTWRPKASDSVDRRIWFDAEPTQNIVS